MPKVKQLFTKKNAILSFVLISVLLISLCYLFGDIKKRRSEIINSKQEISSRINSLFSFASIKKEYQEAEKYSSILKNVLPTRDNLLDFKNEVGRLARKHKVGLGFKFGADKAIADNLRSINFELFVSGQLSKIAEFIKELENSFYMVSLTSFDFQRKISKNKMELKTSGKVFFR